MKILILGDGVIGSVYGWQLSEAGYDVTHFVRKEKEEKLRTNGIPISCLDCRNNETINKNVIYKAKIISCLSKSDKYDLFIISSKAQKITAVLNEFSSKISPETTVLIFQSLWEDIDFNKTGFNEKQIIFGFPHIMGGGKYGDTVKCTIFGNADAPTMLGEKDGSITERIIKIEEAFKRADLNPQVSNNILAWIYAHYGEAAGLLAGIMEAGNYESFVSSRKILKDTIFAIREGLTVCMARGIDAKRIKPDNYYFWPTFIMAPILQKMYSNEASEIMMKGHISHSTDEMKKMVFDVIESGKKYNVDTNKLQEMSKSVIDFKI